MALPIKIRRTVLAIVLALAAVACWRFFWGAGTADSLTLYGNVEIRQVDLGFRVGGRIAEELVDEGARVTTGQVLARLDADLLAQARDQAAAQLRVQQAQLNRLESGYRSEEVAQAEAAVKSAEAQARNAQINLQRVTNLRRSNAVAQKELDNARARHTEAQAQWTSARDQRDMLASGYRHEDVQGQQAAVDGAQAALAHAQTQLDDAVLFAPQEGVVLTRAREVGAIVQPGQTVYTLSLTHPTWLRVYVDEPQLGLVRPGMAVEVLVDAAPGKTFAGEVGFISPTAEFTPKTVETMEVRTALVYRLRVRVDDKENVMRQGMPVTVRIPLHTAPPAHPPLSDSPESLVHPASPDNPASGTR